MLFLVFQHHDHKLWLTRETKQLHGSQKLDVETAVGTGKKIKTYEKNTAEESFTPYFIPYV